MIQKNQIIIINIITVIFTTDFEEPYYINWIDTENINLIEKNKDFIITIMQNKLIDEYIIKSKCIYSFYKYYRDNCPDELNKTAIKNIEYIKDKYNECKDIKSPNYITEFFNNIKFTIENCKDKQSKHTILQHYDDKTYFMEKLEEKIKYSINRYLGIKNDEDDDDE